MRINCPGELPYQPISDASIRQKHENQKFWPRVALFFIQLWKCQAPQYDLKSY
jgi:hypothetical protein